tara:strand:+ start:33 stop:593 length:561 start_codon:yes stop_codon:yes gene_type:complete
LTTYPRENRDSNSPSTLYPFFDALSKNDLARVLADPAIVVRNGCSASLSSGSTVEIAVCKGFSPERETKYIGTKLEVETHLLENGRVRIDYHLDWSELDKSEKKKRYTNPRIHHRVVGSKFEIELGTTFTTSGLITKVSKDDGSGEVNEMELVVLITPELVYGNPSLVMPATHVGPVSLRRSEATK